MKDRVLELVERLRGAGMRIGVGEIGDALEAVAVVGIEREILREALAATLVKDHAQRTSFDALFNETFPTIRLPPAEKRGRAARGGGESVALSKQSRAPEGSAGRRSREEHDEPRGEREGERPGEREGERQEEQQRDESGERQGERQHEQHGESAGESDASSERAARRLGRERELMARPLRDLDSRELPEVRELSMRLARRFERRWSRRERRARRGRIDLRATMRLALARGGVPAELVRKRRRPSRPDLLALVDVSWSTATAASLLLSLLTPCRRFFRRVTFLAYVGDVEEISFEGGHVVPHAPLDLDARSDFGRVLVKLAARDISRREVVLILGDARNNRLPARVDALKALARRARALAWLNPDPPERWGQGDSDIGAYAPHLDVLLGAHDLASLARGLDQFAQRVAGQGSVRRVAAGARRGLGLRARLGMMAPTGMAPGGRHPGRIR